MKETKDDTTMKKLSTLFNVTEFPFVLYDKNGNITYHEDSDEYWYRREYDSNGNETYFENSNKLWYRREFDSNSNETYYEDSTGVVCDTKKQ